MWSYWAAAPKASNDSNPRWNFISNISRLKYNQFMFLKTDERNDNN